MGVSRVGVCGKNGEGKSTAIKLLTGENIPQEGSVYKHPSVRLGYLAQHSFVTINNHPEKTANEYIRWRFEIPGEDREAIKKKTTTLTEEEEKELFKSYKFQFKNSEGELTTVSGVVSGLTCQQLSTTCRVMVELTHNPIILTQALPKA